MEKIIVEMNGKLGRVLEQNDGLGRSLDEIKDDFKKHVAESDIHRQRITILWFSARWFLTGGLLVGIVLAVAKCVLSRIFPS